MRSPLIETGRLSLAPFTAADAGAVHDYCQDPELQRWVPLPVPYSRADAEYFVGGYATDAASSPALTLWSIRSEAGVVGAIELRHEPLASATVGFWLGQPHRGRGIMTEALGALVEYSFEEAGLVLRRLHWESAVGNIASATVARRNGFQFEGVSRRSIIHRGERIDSWQATLLVDDAREAQPGWPL